jgi:hypothetical protein
MTPILEAILSKVTGEGSKKEIIAPADREDKLVA